MFLVFFFKIEEVQHFVQHFVFKCYFQESKTLSAIQKELVDFIVKWKIMSLNNSENLKKSLYELNCWMAVIFGPSDDTAVKQTWVICDITGQGLFTTFLIDS